MRHCKALTHAGQPCRMYPLKNEDFCFQHSDSEKAYQARILSHFKGRTFGHNTRLVRLLKKTLRSEKIGLREKCQFMIRIFDEMDKLEMNEKEELHGGRTNLF